MSARGSKSWGSPRQVTSVQLARSVHPMAQDWRLKNRLQVSGDKDSGRKKACYRYPSSGPRVRAKLRAHWESARNV